MADLHILTAAEDDYFAAVQWYAQRSLPAADGFTKAVAIAFERIINQPDWGALCDAKHRHVLVAGYPYSIVYRNAGPNRVLVVAVAHSSRHPD